MTGWHVEFGASASARESECCVLGRAGERAAIGELGPSRSRVLSANTDRKQPCNIAVGGDLATVRIVAVVAHRRRNIAKCLVI